MIIHESTVKYSTTDELGFGISACDVTDSFPSLLTNFVERVNVTIWGPKINLRDLDLSVSKHKW